MSAYDNPTIIRDDSAMIFGQGIASFGENFAKAMNAQLALAAEERAYEAKLKKQTEEKQIATQLASIKQSTANMKEVDAAVDKVKNADSVFVNKFGELYSDLLKKDGENAVKASFSVLTPEEIIANDKYSKSVNQFKDKTIPTFAGMKQNIDEGKLFGPRDWLNTDWNGDTPLDQKINEISYYASDPENYDYRNRVTKDLYLDGGDPSNPIIEIITKVDREKDLGKFSNEELNAEIAKGKNSSIIYDDATKQYSVKLKKKAGDWDGTFYHKVPEAPDSDKIWGKTQADILDSKTNELKTSFIINPGNPVITKEKIKDAPNKEKQIETIYLNMPAISNNAKPYYDAGARALLNSDLKNPAQLKSFLQNRLYRGNETLEEFFKANPTPQAQEEFFSKKLFEIDVENKLGKEYSNRPATKEDVDNKRALKIGDPVYYTQKSTIVTIPKPEQPGGDDRNKPTADQKNQEAFNNIIIERIKSGKAIPGKDGLYLKVTNGKGSLYKYDSSGLKVKIDTKGDDLQDLVNTIGGTVDITKIGRKKLK